MLNIASQVIVLALGAFMCVFSVWGLAAPVGACNFAIDTLEEDWGIWLAVFLRLLFGAALIAASPISRFPDLFHVLGWFAIVAAVLMLFVGRERLRAIAAWFARLSNTVIRVWLAFALMVGGVLIYGIM